MGNHLLHYIHVSSLRSSFDLCNNIALHSTKGVLLFLTVLLIGAGFGFIKHALSDREKQVLLLVIPLQVGDHCRHWLNRI